MDESKRENNCRKIQLRSRTVLVQEAHPEPQVRFFLDCTSNLNVNTEQIELYQIVQRATKEGSP